MRAFWFHIRSDTENDLTVYSNNNRHQNPSKVNLRTYNSPSQCIIRNASISIQSPRYRVIINSLHISTVVTCHFVEFISPTVVDRRICLYYFMSIYSALPSRRLFMVLIFSVSFLSLFFLIQRQQEFTVRKVALKNYLRQTIFRKNDSKELFDKIV